MDGGTYDGLRISQLLIELWEIPLLAGRRFERPASAPGRARAFALQAAALCGVGLDPNLTLHYLLPRVVSQQEQSRWANRPC
jgi:hypothetical protein